MKNPATTSSHAPLAAPYVTDNGQAQLGEVQTEGLKLVSMADLHNMQVDFPPPLIDGLLEVRDSLLLTGDAGIGKSLVTLSICLAVASGTRLFNQFDVPKARRVLLVQSENSLKATKTRLAAMVETHKHIHHTGTMLNALKSIVTPMKGLDCRLSGDLMNKQFFRDLHAMVRDSGAGLFILDPLISFHRSAENDNVQMRTVLDRLTELCSETGTAVLAVHHHGKGAYTGANQARGATAIKDWARGILTLNKGSKDKHLLVRAEHTKAGNFAPAKPFFFEVQGPAVIMHEPATRCPPSKIEAVLRGMGGSAKSQNSLVNALKVECGIARRTAQESIAMALEFGTIIKKQVGQAHQFDLLEG